MLEQVKIIFCYNMIFPTRAYHGNLGTLVEISPVRFKKLGSNHKQMDWVHIVSFCMHYHALSKFSIHVVSLSVEAFKRTYCNNVFLKSYVSVLKIILEVFQWMFTYSTY